MVEYRWGYVSWGSIMGCERNWNEGGIYIIGVYIYIYMRCMYDINNNKYDKIG
jgi:hypothetical protein